MKVVTWGTRGSLPVAGESHLAFGGNTTCVEVRSDCIPPGTALVVDAGTGFLPCAADNLRREVKNFVMPHTHWHHDHTQGMLIAPPIFMEGVTIDIYGPVENGMGPREVYETIMRPPFHPLNIKGVKSTLKYHGMEEPAIKAIVMHPRGGCKLFDVRQIREASGGRQLTFNGGQRYTVEECLVVTMHWSQHGERTIAYRFDEKPGGKSFVFLTDEEVRASLPQSLKDFIQDADLLIQDAQYSEDVYKSLKGGFGHGTPEYAVSVAKTCGVKRLGLTHHDPHASDAQIEAREAEGRALCGGGSPGVFAAADFMTIEI